MKKIAIIVVAFISLMPVISIAESMQDAPKRWRSHSKPIPLPSIETIEKMSKLGCYAANIFYQSGATISNNGITQTCISNKENDMPPQYVWTVVK